VRILIVEDDRELNGLISLYLKKEYTIDSVYTKEDAISYIDSYIYDIILLDRDLEGEDVGLSLIDMIKSKRIETGVLVISSFGCTDDKIEGLNSGADDYLDKPFEMEELAARIKALARRFVKNDIRIGDMQFDMKNRTLLYGGNEIVFTKKEGEILFYLLTKLNTIVPREELLDAVYKNPENISSNTIDVTITNIRKKLPVNIIKTIKTRGFKIEL
jgi:two-component system OmpR family response regulator